MCVQYEINPPMGVCECAKLKKSIDRFPISAPKKMLTDGHQEGSDTA